METGIGSFSVTAAKAGTVTTRTEAQAATLEPGEGPWRHFICVVPPEYGLAAPVHGNTLEMEGFKGAFKLALSLQGLKLPDGLSFGSEIPFELNANHMAHPEKILADQSILGVLRGAVQLLDRCLGRKLGQPEFLSALNRLGLPTAWRNELANDVFLQPASTPAKSQPKSKPDRNDLAEPDAIDALLASVSVPGSSTPNRPSAVEHFIAEVGNAGTGFVLNEAETRRLRDGLAELLRDLEIGLLDHPDVAGPMGLVLACHSLIRQMRGPKHLHFHLLPGWLTPEAWSGHWEAVQREHPGSLEALVCLTSAAPEKSGWLAPWVSRGRSGRAIVALQLEEKTTAAWLEWVRESAATVYLFQGGVSAAVGEGHFYFRPAALAYLEAVLQNQARLPGAATTSLALADADVDPATHSAVHRVYDTESMQALRDRGLNLPVGSKNRAEVRFLPLLPSP